MRTSELDLSDRNETLREIPTWARRYARNRMLPFVVWQLAFIGFCVAIGGLSAGAAWAFRAGHPRLSAAFLLPLILVCVALVVWSTPRWGGRLMERLAWKAYAKEGFAAPQTPPAKSMRPPVLVLVAVALVLAGVGVCMALGFAGRIPERYMQPVSALYFVPSLVFIYLGLRPLMSALLLIWPVLYVAHALALLAGAPIRFAGILGNLNMLIPTAGYGLVTGLVMHFYSRVALRRLRRLTVSGVPLEAADDAPIAGE